MEGTMKKGASIENRGEGDPDGFKPGAILFTSRTYTGIDDTGLAHP